MRRDKYGPRRTAFATDTNGNPAYWLCGAFQPLRQIAVAGCEAQPWVESVYLNFMARGDFATLQIVFYGEFKKAFGGADKLFGQSKLCGMRLAVAEYA